MKVSVITVVYNDLQGLKRTVASVLGQSTKDFEYIILDGGSTDGCAEYINSLDFKGKKKSEPDDGIYNAMNKAVRMAQGDYCLFMNAGDTFHDDFVVEKAIGIIGDADLYVGHTVEIGENTINGMAPNPLTIEYLLRNSIYHQSTFIRTQLLLERPYNEKHKITSDWEFFFEQWLYGAKYEPLDFFVANYYLGGYSFLHRELIEQERTETIRRLIPQPRLREFFLEGINQEKKSKLEKKIEAAMALPPISRDLKIMRNSLKALVSDLIKNR